MPIITSNTGVSWSSPMTSDTIDTTPQVSCNPSSGSTFGANQATVVTCTARDDAQNSATCMFSVTVGT